MEITEYIQSLSRLQTELGETYKDIRKRIDPDNVSGDLLELQTKVATTTINNLTEAVKSFRTKIG